MTGINTTREGAPRTFVFLIFLSMLFLGVSCENNTISFSASRNTDGGVYLSKDRGDTWEQKVFVGQQGKRAMTIAGANVVRIISDPKDSRIMYVLTRESGIWKTADNGEVWVQVYGGGGINALNIHPNDSQIVYLAAGNTIQKSTTGGGTWGEAYLDPRPGVGVSAVVVDAADPRHVIAATGAGDILESRDSGTSWQVIYRFEHPIVQLLQAGATAVYFAATPSQGIWRTEDAGKSWADATEGLAALPGAREFRALIPDLATPRAFLLSTMHGILRTTDLGESWDVIPLISEPGDVDILSLAVNQKNSSQIYYTVPGALYRTNNGGARWTTLSLPSGKLPTALIVDHFNPSIMYMGFTKPK